MTVLPDAQTSYFVLFGLAPCFFIDTHLLKQRYYALLEKVHPDHFVESPPALQFAATQTTIVVNEAYRTLSTPFLRAQYLLQHVAQHHEPLPNPSLSFLEKQLSCHQRIQMAKMHHQQEPLFLIKQMINQEVQQTYQDFHHYWTDNQHKEAAQALAHIPYYERLITEIDLLLKNMK